MTIEKKKLSATLNLPQIEFPMKADLAKREPGILEGWEAMRLYDLRTKLRGNANRDNTFILHDGPPYANGNIHIGHAVNKVLKDIVIKSQFLSGKHTPYIPGWDCHGLPIEINIEKKLGKVGSKKKEGSEVTASEFRAACREYAESWVQIQKEELKRLGVLGDWEHSYKTMDPKTEANIVRALGKIVEKGNVAQGWKPVHWCFDCGSSLAEAEIEYQDKESPSIDVKFTVIGQKEILEKFKFENSANKGKGEISIVIWTTTPWTLPANRAVALGADIAYALVQVGEERLILAEDLVAGAMARYGITEFEILGAGLGSVLAEKIAHRVELQHPFLNRSLPIVLGEHVTADSGTGAVHMAPAHGEDDYKVGQANGLAIDHYVQGNGCFSFAGGEFSTLQQLENQHIWKANSLIVDLLKQNEKLLAHKIIKHSYPHCWRHKTPVIFRATAQFFITMEGQDALRKNTLEAIKAVNWKPDWGMDRMRLMIEKRPDWCISRQRTWGVPLPFILNKHQAFLKEDQKIDAVADFIEAKGIDAYDEASLKSLDCFASLITVEEYEKVRGVPDVWFESGLTHEVVLQDRYPKLKEADDSILQADVYLEGSDQYRGWFQSSLLTSVAMNGRAPYKQIITHGFVVDAQGRKMSKSIGNVIAPETVIKKFGADVLRLWVASTDYSAEMVISDEVLTRASDVYRRIRNTARFLLANTVDFKSPPEAGWQPPYPGTGQAPADGVVNYYVDLDAWALNKTVEYQNKIIEHYKNYDFVSAVQTIQHFCAIEMGGFYLDVIKDRLYTYGANSLKRRSAQATLHHILEALVCWIAPVLSFTAEEIWKAMPQKRSVVSVHLSKWHNLDFVSKHLNFNWDNEIIPLRNAVNKQLETARQTGAIGSPLEAKVMLYVHDVDLKIKLEQFGKDLKYIFIISEVEIEEGSKASSIAILTEDYPQASIEISKLEYEKCARCWHRCPDLKSHPEYEEKICGRCEKNII